MFLNPVSHVSQSPGSARVQSQVSFPFVVQAKGKLTHFRASQKPAPSQTRVKSDAPVCVEGADATLVGAASIELYARLA